MAGLATTRTVPFRFLGPDVFTTGGLAFIGQQGKLEKVAEYRLETIVPERILNSLVQAMIEAHPYEEVAYDVYHLCTCPASRWSGQVRILQEPMKLGRANRTG